MGGQINEAFLTNVADILEQARQNAKAAIDLSMVYAYFEIGKLIVEEEQSGGQRAAYGKYVIPELSQYLTAHLGRGFSVTNLKQMRKFYQVYAGDQIGQTLSDQFSNLPAVSTGRKFPLSWSHYLKLMRIDNADQRHFYEIEAAQNHWGLKELQRRAWKKYRKKHENRITFWIARTHGSLQFFCIFWGISQERLPYHSYSVPGYGTGDQIGCRKQNRGTGSGKTNP